MIRISYMVIFWTLVAGASAHAEMTPANFTKALDFADKLENECVQTKKSCKEYVSLKADLKSQASNPKLARQLSTIDLCRAGIDSACQSLQMMQQTFMQSGQPNSVRKPAK